MAELAICYREARVGEIRGVRGAVLRPGTGVLVLPGDEAGAPLTWHFGAFLGGSGGRNVACVTYLASTYEGEAAMQLRGMAVEEGYRGQGVGGKLIDFAEGIVTGNGVGVLWCNARVRAVGFYERHGWRCVSEEFLVAGVGPHRVMVKEV